MRAEIRSKLIDVATYDAEAKSLCLHMTNGERREFSGVPQSVFEKLLKARSPGQFYFEEIRNRFVAS